MANTTDCPGTLNCPALPRVSLDQAVIDLLESIALQESALSHILCAESQKMKTCLLYTSQAEHPHRGYR